jgi:hypothetical protein
MTDPRLTRRRLLGAALTGLAALSATSSAANTQTDPDLCRDDVAIDTNTAQIFPVQAPLTPEANKKDARAVWARVLPRPDSTVLVFLHGHNNYVTVDAQGRSRVPDWAADDPQARAGAASKPAAPLIYGLNALNARKLRKSPLVLVPEDAVLAHGSFWATEPRVQYQDPARLGSLIADSRAHLACLHRPDGRPYLSSHAASSALKRLYLCGHSGAGLPLQEAAGSSLALPATGIPTDLWLFDCTYWSDVAHFAQFCVLWNGVGRLAAGRRDAARFLCVYRPQTQTEGVADVLRGQIAQALGVTPESLVKDHGPDNFDSVIRPALQTSSVLFVRTFLAHDDIPTFYIPHLLQTAAV